MSFNYAKPVLHVEEGIAQVLIFLGETLVQIGTGPDKMVFFSGLPADIKSLLNPCLQGTIFCALSSFSVQFLTRNVKKIKVGGGGEQLKIEFLSIQNLSYISLLKCSKRLMCEGPLV